MLLRVILMFCFEILSDFGENRKRGKMETIWAVRVPMLQRRAFMLRCSPTL